jgi:hypothetical protein
VCTLFGESAHTHPHPRDDNVYRQLECWLISEFTITRRRVIKAFEAKLCIHIQQLEERIFLSIG